MLPERSITSSFEESNGVRFLSMIPIEITFWIGSAESSSGVSQSVMRGEKIAEIHDYKLLERKL